LLAKILAPWRLMSKEFKTGIVTGVVIYVIGGAVSYFAQLLMPPDGEPPNSVLPIYLLLAIGFVRLIMSAGAWFAQNSERAKGELMTHVIGVIVIFILLARVS
jgi:hypothetical protein